MILSYPSSTDCKHVHNNHFHWIWSFVYQVEQPAYEVRAGLVGCMKNLKIDDKPLPLSGSSPVAVLQDLEQIEFHCNGIYVPGKATRDWEMD